MSQQKLHPSPEGANNTTPAMLETTLPDVVLRHMNTVEDDALFFDFQQRNRDHIVEFGNSIDGTVEEATQSRLAKGNLRFGIWQSDTLIGMVGGVVSEDGRELEMGIIIDKDSTGQGIASASTVALTDYATTRFDRVFAEVRTDHTKSIELLNRIGYLGTGELVTRDWGQAYVFEAKR